MKPNHLHVRLPGVDATLALHCDNGLLALDFLAQGRSQVKRAGIVTGYNKRNPERRALFNHVVSLLATAQGRRVIGHIVGQRHGKGAGTVDAVTLYSFTRVNGDVENLHFQYCDARRLTHKGPLRMALFIKPAHDVEPGHLGSLHCLAKALGLVPVEHRPTPINWPLELSC